jgi:DNA topoisomerase-2
MLPEELAKAKEAGFQSVFKLTNTVSETNLVLFDHKDRIKKYKNPLEIMEEFASVRLHYYDVRKKYMIDKLTQERDVLSNRARFIAMIIANKLKINNRKKDELVKDLTRLKFQKFGDSSPPRSGFEYLLIMHIQSLTRERKLELERILADKTKELEKLKKTTIQQLWLGDLDRLEKAITDLYATDDLPPAKGAKGKKRKAPSTSKGKKGEEEDEEEEDNGDEFDANPLKDVSRWISVGVHKGPAGGPAKKKRKMA